MDKDLLRGKSAFIVDDTGFMRANLAKQLIDIGFSKEKIFQFENGRLALDALPKHKVDVLFTDWNMPIMNGLEFIKHIRASNSSFSQVPVVMITTESEKSKIIEALQFRISGYILKPIQGNKIEEVLELIFGDSE